MNAFANIKTITKRELGAYFSSPLAYIFIVIFLLLCGFFTFFVGGFFEREQASLGASFFEWRPWFYLFLVPAVGMRLWAEERRVGTIELLLTMPITAWQAIVGKFLASWLFLLQIGRASCRERVQISMSAETNKYNRTSPWLGTLHPEDV